jgi:hypothetical protein
MSHSSYSGGYLLHSYLTCSVESESYEPICFKAFVEKGMEQYGGGSVQLVGL